MARILVVDDAKFMRMMITNILEKAGHEVVGEAVDGEDALVQFKKCTPDLVTMDITMPNRDGLHALRDIRDFDPSAKIIMCSAMGQQAMVVEAIQHGARDFIVKPFQEDRVLEAIKKVLS